MKGHLPKLTPKQIKEIKDAPKYHRTELLAKFYKVSVARISQIRKGVRK
jgi:hypothetical protein